ncbi:MAG: hypothetical protein V4669_18950 [Pseudomonadota bacterium]
MSEASSVRERLMKALEESDVARRKGRAERIEWLSLHNSRPGAIFGRTETMRILDEAPDAFVDGYFVGALLLATSFIEHALAEELQDRGLAERSPNFAEAVTLCREHGLFAPEWLDRTDALRIMRNPYAHLKQPSHPHTMGNRYRSLKAHPLRMLEADAKEALELMFFFFRATLRQADF